MELLIGSFSAAKHLNDAILITSYRPVLVLAIHYVVNPVANREERLRFCNEITKLTTSFQLKLQIVFVACQRSNEGEIRTGTLHYLLAFHYRLLRRF